MRIINKTQWDTRLIRRVLSSVLAANNKHEGKLAWPVKVTISTGRRWDQRAGHGIGGYAYLRSGRVKLKLPLPERTPGKLDSLQLAWVFEHELCHCRGHRHRTMARAYMDRSTATAERYPVAAATVIGVEVAKPRPDPVATRATRARTALVRLETRAKRIATAIRKRKRQVAYYEKRLQK